MNNTSVDNDIECEQVEANFATAAPILDMLDDGFALAMFERSPTDIASLVLAVHVALRKRGAVLDERFMRFEMNGRVYQIARTINGTDAVAALIERSTLELGK